jgi:hypothetical protein
MGFTDLQIVDPSTGLLEGCCYPLFHTLPNSWDRRAAHLLAESRCRWQGAEADGLAGDRGDGRYGLLDPLCDGPREMDA